MNHSFRPSTCFRVFTLPVLAVVALGALSYACGSEEGESPAVTREALGEAPPLGAARSFAVLGGSTVTNTNATIITGNLGVNPGLAITGFPPGLVLGGAVHAGDAVALQAQTDVTAAYDALDSKACAVDLTGKDLGGLTLTPGTYCFSSSAQLTGTLVLDAAGRADAVFVFKTVSTLVTASNASVVVINGGSACNVFWKVGSSATLGTGTTFAGSILALTSISLTSRANLSGRALARNGAVTMDENVVNAAACAAVADAGVADAAPAADAAKPDGAVANDAGALPDASPPKPDAAPVEPDAGVGDDGGTFETDSGPSF